MSGTRGTAERHGLVQIGGAVVAFASQQRCGEVGLGDRHGLRRTLRTELGNPLAIGGDGVLQVLGAVAAGALRVRAPEIVEQSGGLIAGNGVHQRLLECVDRRIDVGAALAGGGAHQRPAAQLVQREERGAEPVLSGEWKDRVGDRNCVVGATGVQGGLGLGQPLFEQSARAAGDGEPVAMADPRAGRVGSAVAQQPLHLGEVDRKARDGAGLVERGDGLLVEQCGLGHDEGGELLGSVDVEDHRDTLTGGLLAVGAMIPAFAGPSCCVQPVGSSAATTATNDRRSKSTVF